MTEINLCASYSAVNKAEFIVDAVLFDMDGTLVDSIPAIESAWAAVAKKINKDPAQVIEATHGRRVMDNLKDLYPNLRKNSDAEMEPHVREFEIEILRQADEYGIEIKSRRSSAASSRRASRSASFVATPEDREAVGKQPRRKSNLSHSITPAGVSERMAAMGIKPLSATNSSTSVPTVENRELTPAELLAKKKLSVLNASSNQDVFEEDAESDGSDIEIDVSDLVDRSVRILPGVRKMTDALPSDRFAIATSAAVTHCHGALARVGISLPKVTVTADDPRLERGKPFPDPFVLAAKTLGFKPENCVVVEDSPFGIQAGVAAGGKTIAVSTSHSHDKIAHCGATWLIPTLDLVQVEVLPDGRIRIFIDATDTQVEQAIAQSVRGKIAAKRI